MTESKSGMDFTPGSYHDAQDILRCLNRLDNKISRTEGKVDMLVEDKRSAENDRRKIEDRIRSLEGSRSRVYGYVAAGGALVAAAWYFVRDTIKGALFG